ncbi:MAG TPA: hypothetical protein VJ729_12975 [Nitrososphaeraceae archaeon]|nr:hypothetical protein [Nitrososphaeraceae archaeon]
MMKTSSYGCLVAIFTIVYMYAVFSSQNYNITEAAAQIESNSTFTTCINGKCVTTTMTCAVNQLCHTIRSNASNTNDNNSTNATNNGKNTLPTPFDQGTI